MRKLKLLLASLAMIVGGVNSVSATDWTGNAAGAGTFYLYNVGADRFLGYGANWGTRATVEHAGIPVTLASAGEGVYTITTNVVENGKCLNVNGYMDSSSSNWTFSSVTGETNTYQISSDGKYLFWDGTTVNYTTSVDATLPSIVANSYWKLVSTSDRDAAFTAMNATEATPLDVTYKYIENPNTTYYTNIYSNANPWGGNSWKLDGYQNWQDAKDQCGERYNMNFDTYITIENIPNGEYEFGVQGFYRDGAGDAAIANYHAGTFTPNAKIYANSNTTDMQSIAVANRTTEFNSTDSKKEIDGTTYYVPNNQYMAEVYTYAGYYPWQNVRTVVTDGTLRFGVKKEATISLDWTIVDKFYLSYLGPTIAAKAVALPAGDMAAGTWYYFDVAIDGKYNLTLTTLADIVYTTDNTILYENQGTVTTNFAGTSEITLAAGRYYVKSTSAQTLSVAAASYSYAVGTPTSSIADGSYQKSISTVTLNFADAASNDPSATFAILNNTAKAILKLAGSTVAEGTLSLDGKVLTATFPETALTLGSTYTLELAADVVGYAGQAANTAVSVTVNTPAVADGFYYLYNTYTNTYLSRSGNYATQAIMDNRGMAVELTTDVEGKTIVQYFDNRLYLGNNGFCYGDAGTAHQFTVTAVEGGYKFLCVSNSKYLAVYDGQSVNDAVEGDNLQGTSNIWALETPAQHVANYTTNANTQVATATANISVLSSITTKSSLETELDTNYGETNISITGSKDAKYQVYAGNSQALSEAEYYKETVENLKPGLYKLSVDAFQRASWYDWVYAAGGARGNIYLYANDAKTQIKSVMEYGADAEYSSNKAYDGKNYPDNDASAYAALETGNYSNDVYVYVAADEGKETGTLVIGINNPTRQGNGVSNGTWAVYNNWTLTYYEAKATADEKEALADAIEAAEANTLGFETGNYAPYNNVAALEALAAAKAITPETASGEAVVAATTALTGATWTANDADVECVYNGNFAEGQGSPAANIQQYAWTRTNAWGQFKNDGYGSTTAYYNQPGSLQYGNAGVYTMPLKAQTIYRLQFKYAKWDGDFAPTVSVLNGENGMAAQTFENASSSYKDGYNSVDMVFVTATAGNYVLSLSASSNYVVTDVSITKAASQVLEFADGSVPTYAPGTYPSVKITRTLTANRWATAVYPFAVSGVSGLEIANLDSYSEGALGFSTTAAASEANVPFLMRSTAGATEISLSNVEVATAAATDATVGEVASLKGVYTETTVNAGDGVYNYVLSSNTIYKVGDKAATINPYRAYIQLTQPTGARLTFTIDGEETAIEGITVERQLSGEVYNLNGQRVDSPRKGLYIQNGKKVVVK